MPAGIAIPSGGKNNCLLPDCSPVQNQGSAATNKINNQTTCVNDPRPPSLPAPRLNPEEAKQTKTIVNQCGAATNLPVSNPDTMSLPV